MDRKELQNRAMKLVSFTSKMFYSCKNSPTLPNSIEVGYQDLETRKILRFSAHKGTRNNGGNEFHFNYDNVTVGKLSDVFELMKEQGLSEEDSCNAISGLLETAESKIRTIAIEEVTFIPGESKKGRHHYVDPARQGNRHGASTERGSRIRGSQLA